MTSNIDNIVITSEEQAWDVLEKALKNEINESVNISFEKWPVLRLTIEGKDFKGSVPTRIMPPILELQKEINRLYCEAKYRTTDTKKLTDAEREALELVVIIKPGSTKFVADLFKALNEVIKSSNMDGQQVLILLISISTLLTAGYMWKKWVDANERKHGLDNTVKLSEKETERIKLITEAMIKVPEIKSHQNSLNEFQNDLARKLKPTDRIIVDDVPIIDGKHAAEITPPPKSTSKDIRLDGKYLITQVKLPSKFGGDYRLSVTRISDGLNFLVDVSSDLLNESKLKILKDASFEVKAVEVEINAKQYRGEIFDAQLISIELAEKEESSNV